MTFDEAVRTHATDDQYKPYVDSVIGKVVALRERQALAERLLGKRVVFDWELPRTPLGQYMWQWSSKAVIDRCLVAAPLGDLSWSRQGEIRMPNPSFHRACASS